jgi:hypothetical protein
MHAGGRGRDSSTGFRAVFNAPMSGEFTSVRYRDVYSLDFSRRSFQLDDVRLRAMKYWW